MADNSMAFMNGAAFDSSGNALNSQAKTDIATVGGSGTQYSGYVPPAQATPANTGDFTVPAPSTVPSSVLTSNVSDNDLLSHIKQFQTKQDDLFSKLSSFYETPVSPEEQAAQTKYNDLTTQIDQLGLDTQNKVAATGTQGILGETANVQAADAERLANYKLSSLGIQQKNALMTLQNMQSNRQQKFEAAKFLYDANRNSLNDTLALYKATAPENISTQVDPDTGRVSVVTRNPLTGQISTQYAGNTKISQPFYEIGGTVYRTSDGYAIHDPVEAAKLGVDTLDWANVQHVQPDHGDEKKAVLSLAQDYPDAGIQPTDSLVAAQSKLPNSRIYKQKTRLSGGSGGGGGGSGSGLVQAILANPQLYSTLTPTQRGQVLPQLQAMGVDLSSLTAKQLSDTAIGNINQTNAAITQLKDLKQKLTDNQQLLGPISGLQALNPWSKAKKVQADIDRVKQEVGKALEGGVLRKEDEDKYKKILATLTDTPATASYKVDAILSDLQSKIDNYVQLQGASGRNISGITQSPPEDLRQKYNY